MEGPHIKLDTEHEYSGYSEDGGFEVLLNKSKEINSSIAPLLEDLSRSTEKQKIILEALLACSLDWLDMQKIEEKKETKESFGHLLAHWDTPLNDKPKTKEDHYAEALEFAKLLK